MKWTAGMTTVSELDRDTVLRLRVDAEELIHLAERANDFAATDDWETLVILQFAALIHAELEKSKQTINISPFQYLSGIHDLLLKAARRCAYDLSHAASEISVTGGDSTLFYERAQMWQRTFSPDGLKLYHSELSNKIQMLERELHDLRGTK